MVFEMNNSNSLQFFFGLFSVSLFDSFVPTHLVLQANLRLLLIRASLRRLTLRAALAV